MVLMIRCCRNDKVPPMNIQAVIFDRDNTLLRFDPAATAAIEARIAAAAPSLPANAVGNHWISWPGPWPRMIEHEPAFWQAFWGRLAEQYQLPAGASTALLE